MAASGAGGGGVQARADLRAGAAAVVALDRLARVAGRDEQHVAAAVHPLAAGLGDDPQRGAEVRERAGLARDLLGGAQQRRSGGGRSTVRSSLTASAARRSAAFLGSVTITSPAPSTVTRTRRARAERRIV